MRLYGSIEARGCGRRGATRVGLRRPGFLGSGFQPRSSKMSSVPRLGVRARPARRGGAGKGARTAEPAPAANSYPFGRDRGGCGRDPVDQLTSLASLVEPETFRALLRHRWREDGRKLSAYTHGVAVTLIAIASEWVKAPADVIATLKALRSKLGTLPSGLTEKNKALLRKFDDPRLLDGFGSASG